MAFIKRERERDREATEGPGFAFAFCRQGSLILDFFSCTVPLLMSVEPLFFMDSRLHLGFVISLSVSMIWFVVVLSIFSEEEYSETINKSNGSEKMIIESLMSFKRQDSKEADLEVSDSSKNTVPERDSSNSKSSMAKNHEIMQIKKPCTLLLPKPVILFSPRPVSELDAAATRLQKVYKSYRTRRNLADCAVVVEELWFVSISFLVVFSFFRLFQPMFMNSLLRIHNRPQNFGTKTCSCC